MPLASSKSHTLCFCVICFVLLAICDSGIVISTSVEADRVLKVEQYHVNTPSPFLQVQQPSKMWVNVKLGYTEAIAHMDGRKHHANAAATFPSAIILPVYIFEDHMS